MDKVFSTRLDEPTCGPRPPAHGCGPRPPPGLSRRPARCSRRPFAAIMSCEPRSPRSRSGAPGP